MAIVRRTSSPGAIDTLVPHAGARQARTPELPAGCDISFIHKTADLAALEHGWTRLEGLSPSGHRAFQSFDWLLSWAETYSPRLFVATGTRRGEMVFAWPMMLVRVGPVKVLRWLSEPHAQYGDVLAAQDESPRMWVENALDRVRHASNADIIRLRHVREDAQIAPVVETAFRRSNMDDKAPSLDLTAFADEAAYEARYTSTQRKRRRKIRKSLEDAFGPLRYEIIEDFAARSAAVRAALEEKSRWVDSRGRHNRILACPFLLDFLDRLAARGEDAGRIVVSQLSAGGEPISWDIGLRHGGTHFCYVTSHVTALTDYSPARLHMDFSQRQALKDGMQTFDLMVPDDPYKDSWCSSRMPTHDFHLPLTPLGKLYGTGYLENLRPVLREAYHSAPPPLLRLLKPLLGH